MTAQLEVLRGTTDGDGAAVVDTVNPICGEVLAVFVDGAALTDSANLVLQPVLVKAAGADELGESIVNHADIGNATIDKVYPRRLATDAAGAALEVATGQNVAIPFVVPGAKLRATISAGGATKAFTVTIVWR